MSSDTTTLIKTIPDNFTAITPWIISSSSEKMIQFMEAAFGAQEVPNARITNEEGIIIHTVVKIGSAMVLLFDAREGWGPTPSFLNLYVDDIESVLAKSKDT